MIQGVQQSALLRSCDVGHAVLRTAGRRPIEECTVDLSPVTRLSPLRGSLRLTLMEEFYRQHGSGADPARALANAQRALLRTGTTAHPFYWAGVVVVVGSGR